MRNLLLITLIFVCTKTFAQTDTPVFKLISPSGIHQPKGYSHAAIVNLGNAKMVIMAGQVGLNEKGDIAGTDVEKQTYQIFRNIKTIVENAGGSMNDIVKLNYYMLDVGQIQAVRMVRDKFINVQNPPVSTLVQVNKLFRNDILIEIEATAIIENKE